MEDRAKTARFFSCIAECYARDLKGGDEDDDLCVTRCWDMYYDEEEPKTDGGERRPEEKKKNKI